MVQTLARSEARSKTRPALIDGDFHNELDSIKDIYPYLAKRWQTHIETHGVRGPAGGTYPRFMDHREDARPPSGRVSGSEVGWSAKDYLDPYNVAHAMCIPLTPAGRQLNFELDAALASAVNDWQINAGLDRRLHREPAGRRCRDQPRRQRQAVRAGPVLGPAAGADGPPQILADLRGRREARPAHHVARLRLVRQPDHRRGLAVLLPGGPRRAGPGGAGERGQPHHRGRLRPLPGSEVHLGRERLRLDPLADVADGLGLVAAQERGAPPEAEALGVLPGPRLHDHPAGRGAAPPRAVPPADGPLRQHGKQRRVRQRLPALGLGRPGLRPAARPPG